MDRQFDALPIRELGAGAGFRRPLQAAAARVTLGSPALEVMTDLASVSPATIRPQAPLAAANQLMITRRVRLLARPESRWTPRLRRRGPLVGPAACDPASRCC